VRFRAPSATSIYGNRGNELLSWLAPKGVSGRHCQRIPHILQNAQVHKPWRTAFFLPELYTDERGSLNSALRRLVTMEILGCLRITNSFRTIWSLDSYPKELSLDNPPRFLRGLIRFLLSGYLSGKPMMEEKQRYNCLTRWPCNPSMVGNDQRHSNLFWNCYWWKRIDAEWAFHVLFAQAVTLQIARYVEVSLMVRKRIYLYWRPRYWLQNLERYGCVLGETASVTPGQDEHHFRF
jgi:hypothetical protein